ncbi:Trk system potassium transporter TrkA [Desulfosudis oleivorans]|uniref:Trk system potassium uptake protein TrkA n=1 Tax=Desulfosudis oleivorans (strain DSM 6200 / JCM 39069 / Hxd3) TaxID=96561 RepID=A9A0A2_DESOH|nr:Trk system potassium transporter TrkA [Desulfosudis oleivorans]ABW69021.1 TrkA-N domain protein [Desulfosudis oleivorans Hxd3]
MKILIIGAGEVGFHIANRLSAENKNVVVVDKNPDALRRVTEYTDVQTVVGSGSSPAVLEEAGIKEAEIILAVTDSDETNLVACLTADILSPSTKKLARVRNADFDPYHEIFREKAPHIDTVINPEIEVVKTIERLISVSGAVEVEDLADGRLKLVGLRLDNSSVLNGQRLSEVSVKTGDSNFLVAAIVRNEKMIVPRGDSRLMANDLVYFISEKEKLANSLNLFGKPLKPVKRVMIVGGGRVGARLAMRLEKEDIKVKIIESNPDRCAQLAEKMTRAVVLHGDGSDQELLTEENIADMDVVASLTSDEQTNILISLLAKRLGAANTITKISKFTYIPLMATIGIEQIISSRLSAINSILQHIRKGRVLSAISLKGEQAEVIEAMALSTSELVGAPLRKISMPKGSLVVGVVRDQEIIVPSGETVIAPNDRVIIFAQRETVPKIEKLLSVKLEFF